MSLYVFTDIPTCFSIDGGQRRWHEESMETCRHPSMFIKSMSYLGFPFVNTTEKWTIYVPSRRIHLQVLDFNIPCFTCIKLIFLMTIRVSYLVAWISNDVVLRETIKTITFHFGKSFFYTFYQIFFQYIFLVLENITDKEFVVK